MNRRRPFATDLVFAVLLIAVNLAWLAVLLAGRPDPTQPILPRATPITVHAAEVQR